MIETVEATLSAPPTEPRWQRFSWLTGAVIVSLLATLHSPFGADPDVWWHLTLGRYIQTQGIPTVEPFAYLPAAHPWVDQQWLYEVLLAKLVAIGGFALPTLVFGALASGAFLLAARSAAPHVRGVWLALSLALNAFIAIQILGVRGQVITVAGTAAVLWILVRWRRGNERIVWLLPPLLLVWCNLHAGFIVGLILALVTAACPRPGESVRFLGRHRNLLLATAVAAAATLLNPAGPKLWPYVMDTFTNPTLTQSIDEWRSPDFHNFFLRLFEVTMMALVSCWILARDVDVWDVVLALGAFAATLQAQRNVALFAIVATPQLATYAQSSWERHRPRLRLHAPRLSTPQQIGIAVAALLSMTLASVGSLIPLVRSAADGSYETTHWPQAAADYVAAHYPGQRLYNTYNAGGYLVYRFPTQRTVFIYGESAVFGDQGLQKFLSIDQLSPNWADQLHSLAASHAIVLAQSQETAAFREVGWRVDCYDRQSGYVAMSDYSLPPHASPLLTRSSDPGLTVAPPPAPQDAPPCAPA